MMQEEINRTKMEIKVSSTQLKIVESEADRQLISKERLFLLQCESEYLFQKIILLNKKLQALQEWKLLNVGEKETAGFSL